MKAVRKREFVKLMAGTQLVVAPMVTQSDAPFRIMCKLHGATMGFTQVYFFS